MQDLHVESSLPTNILGYISGVEIKLTCRPSENYTKPLTHMDLEEGMTGGPPLSSNRYDDKGLKK